MIRAKYKFGPGITGIDEKIFEIFLQWPSNFESKEEEEEEDSHRDGSKIEKFSDTSIQSNIEDFSSSHINQTSRFLPLVTGQIPVKTAAADAGTNFNSEY
ncbi:hypothetical protein G6F37_011666 [Rhizopus arrhizus]|nr:hypothetical protein G6F38_008731 [Rhizopus arrhizus]KAG1148106.1 hypothetical protein G6F37_011666 [Rhizopus arrhizus]